ncbi:hypothetical protein PLICRDRAFT_68745, partial [Plicaturopsis crispa FD-325 SS-3]
WDLQSGGVYTSKARALARALVFAGCAQESVRTIIGYLAKSAGLLVKGRMSRWTVKCSLIEGGIASRIQTGFEMAVAKKFMASGDGTSHCSINSKSQHVMMLAPLYKEGDTSPLVHRNRLISVNSTVDHTSKTQVKNWQQSIDNISTAYMQSPLRQRLHHVFLPTDFDIGLQSMNGDHASDQKKTVCLMKELKHTETCRALGYEHILSLAMDALDTVLSESKTSRNAAAGGAEAWSLLSREAQAAHTLDMMSKLAVHLGQHASDELLEETRRELSLFFWVGCSMHKELNVVKGGNTAMMLWWGLNGVEPLIVLANRDNAAAIRLAKISEESSPIVQRALESSRQGSAKLVALVGAVVNHKD